MFTWISPWKILHQEPWPWKFARSVAVEPKDPDQDYQHPVLNLSLRPEMVKGIVKIRGLRGPSEIPAICAWFYPV